MKKSLFILLLICCAAGFVFAQKTSVKPRPGSVAKPVNYVKIAQKQNELLPMLPSADAVISMDLQRMLSAMPIVLDSNPTRMAQINTQIDKVKADTGIDVRAFQNIGWAIRFNSGENGQINADSVALVRGNFNANALLAVAKVAAKGKYREEKSGERTIYIFNASEILKDVKDANPNISAKKSSMIDGAADWMMKQFSGEIAATVLDDKTLAIGSRGMLDETLNAASRVSPELMAIANAKPNAMLSFAGNVPQQTAKIFGFDNDEIGKMLRSLRQVYGSFYLNAVNGSLQIAGRTSQNDEAKQIEETLLGFQMIGSGMLGAKKDDSSKIYTRMVDNAKITRNANEVRLDLDVPTNDMRKLVAKF